MGKFKFSHVLSVVARSTHFCFYFLFMSSVDFLIGIHCANKMLSGKLEKKIVCENNMSVGVWSIIPRFWKTNHSEKICIANSTAANLGIWSAISSSESLGFIGVLSKRRDGAVNWWKSLLTRRNVFAPRRCRCSIFFFLFFSSSRRRLCKRKKNIDILQQFFFVYFRRIKKEKRERNNIIKSWKFSVVL